MNIGYLVIDSILKDADFKGDKANIDNCVSQLNKWIKNNRNIDIVSINNIINVNDKHVYSIGVYYKK